MHAAPVSDLEQCAGYCNSLGQGVMTLVSCLLLDNMLYSCEVCQVCCWEACLSKVLRFIGRPYQLVG